MPGEKRARKNNSLHYILQNEMAYLGKESYNSAQIGKG